MVTSWLLAQDGIPCDNADDKISVFEDDDSNEKAGRLLSEARQGKKQHLKKSVRTNCKTVGKPTKSTKEGKQLPKYQSRISLPALSLIRNIRVGIFNKGKKSRGAMMDEVKMAGDPEIGNSPSKKNPVTRSELFLGHVDNVGVKSVIGYPQCSLDHGGAGIDVGVKSVIGYPQCSYWDQNEESHRDSIHALQQLRSFSGIVASDNGETQENMDCEMDCEVTHGEKSGFAVVDGSKLFDLGQFEQTFTFPFKASYAQVFGSGQDGESASDETIVDNDFSLQRADRPASGRALHYRAHRLY